MFQQTEVKPRTICGHQVTLALYDEAKAIRNRGGKCFFVVEEVQDDDGPVSCPECNGAGYQYLQHVTGGPFDSAPSGKGQSVIYEAGKWYTVKTEAYQCPVCLPGW